MSTARPQDTTFRPSVEVNPLAQSKGGPPALTTEGLSILWLCTGCGKSFPRTRQYFYHTKQRADELTTRCRYCLAAYVRKQSRKYRLANPDKAREKCNEWHRRNRDKLAEYHQSWSSRNRDRIAEQLRRWRKANPERQRAINARWRRSDRPRAFLYRLSCGIRNRIVSVLRGKSKAASTLELLGCSAEQLKAYLESRFQPGMTWENYGNKKGITCWHIDHVKECCKFDLSKPEQQRACFHYTNLQPMWGKDNYNKEVARKREAAALRRLKAAT